MNKKIIAVFLILLIIIAVPTVLAGGISILSNPDLNLDNPESLPYSASFSFKNSSTTKAIEGSDGTITVELENASVNTNSDANVKIKVYYRNSSNTYWYSGNSATVTIDGTATTYSVDLSVPSNRIFYIKLSKTDLKKYYASGTVYVEN